MASGLLFALMLGGCGQATEVAAPSAEDPITGTSTAEVHRQAALFVDRWYGSQKQRAAAELIVAHELNGSRADCMLERGYAWDWAQGVFPAEPIDPLAATGWFAAPDVPPRSASALAWAPYHAQEREMNADGGLPADEDEAMTACLKTAEAAAPDDEVEAIRAPDSRQTLASAWVDALEKVSAPFGPRSEYEACMTEERLELLDGQPFTDIRIREALLASQPRDEFIPIGQEDSSEEWIRFLAVERTVMTADWTCRRDVFSTGSSELASTINDFAVDHAREITALEDHWASVEVRAASLGSDSKVG